MRFELEKNDSLSSANLLKLGVAITGQSNSYYDVDYYKVSATAGSTVEITLEPSVSAYSPKFPVNIAMHALPLNSTNSA